MTGTYIKGNESFNFDFYTDLTAANKIKFVNSIVNILVDENYNSIIKDLIFDFYIIDVFTTVDIEELKQSSFFVDDVEKFLEETNIVDVVKANVKIGLIEELEKAVNLAIEYRTGIHENPLNEALTSLVNTLEKKLNTVDLNSMMEMANLFSSMSEEFTPENVVKAYMNTDTHKKYVAELEDSKEQKAKIADDISKVVDIATTKTKTTTRKPKNK